MASIPSVTEHGILDEIDGQTDDLIDGFVAGVNAGPVPIVAAVYCHHQAR